MNIEKKPQMAALVAAIFAALTCLSNMWTNYIENEKTAVFDEIKESGTGLTVDFKGFYGETDVFIIDIDYIGDGTYIVAGETGDGDVKEFIFRDDIKRTNMLVWTLLISLISFVGSLGLFTAAERFLPDDFLESDVRE